jgi:hypothetical protein
MSLAGKIFDKLADVGDFFAGPEKVKLTGRLAQTNEGWALELPQVTELRNTSTNRVALNYPKIAISTDLNGKRVSVTGRLAKGKEENLILEPEHVEELLAEQAASIIAR